MQPKFKKSVRFLLIAVVFFTAGFLVHAIFFPYLLIGNPDVSVSIPNRAPTGQPNTMITRVTYNKGAFSPRVVQIEKSYYISIINESDTETMFLASDHPLISTPRGYGKSEELRTILYETGTYTVYNKNNPQNKLKVIVK